MQTIALIAIMVLSLMTGTVSAQQPRKLSLELIWVSETNAHIFVVGGVGFQSVASLKKFLGEQPAGTVVEWSPGCLRMGNEPLLSSEKDLNEFRKYLEERSIKFVLVPSG